MSSASTSATPTNPSSSSGSSGSSSFGNGAFRSASKASAKPGTATSTLVDDLRNAKFTSAFRGYDPAEVRAFVQRMATRVEAELGLMDRVVLSPITSDGELVLDEAAYLAATEAVASALDSVPDTGSRQTPDEVLLAAQSEYESILASARNEANAIVVKANDDAARIILRARAESRGKPSADSSAVVEAAYAQAANDPELAREQARLMITEARAVRERILTDLNKRRRVAHVQLEQLRVAREKLTETLREARRIVDDSARDLSTAEVEARLAADAAGRRISAEALPSIGELEVELWGGRHMPSTRTFTGSSTPVSDADDSFETSRPAPVATPVIAAQGQVLGAFTIEPSTPTADPVAVEQAAEEVAPEVQAAANAEVAEVAEVDRGGSAALVNEDSASHVEADVLIGEGGLNEVAVHAGEAVQAADEVKTADEGHAAQTVHAGAEVQSAKAVHAAQGVQATDETKTAAEVHAGEAGESVAEVQSAEAAEVTKKRAANVDDLFARLRADRERAAIQARSVLGVKESDEGDSFAGAVLDLRTSNGEDSGDSISRGKNGSDGGGGSKRSKGTQGTPKPLGRGDSSDHASQSVPVQAGGVAILDRAYADEQITAIVLDLRPSKSPIELRNASAGSSIADTEHTVSEADDGMDFVVGPLHSSLIRTVKRRLHDEQSSILALLRSHRGTLDVDRLLGSAHDHQLRLTAEIQPIFVDAFRVGAEKSGATMSEAEINDLLREHIESVAASVTAKIRAEVAMIVAEQGNNDSRALGESLTSTYRTWTTERIGIVVTGAVVETYRLGTAA